MMRLRFLVSGFMMLLWVSLLCSGPVLAQQPTPQPPPPQSSATDTKNQSGTDPSNGSSDDAPSLEHPVAVASTTPPVRQINNAGSLMQSISPLRLGPFYVGYAQFAEIFNEGSSFNNQGTFQNAASQLSANIIFDKRFRNARIALQYVPRMTILNGRVLGDFVNQETGANVVFALTPRLSMDLADHFTYYRSKSSFADIFLSADPVSGATLQKDFIEAPASWLSNSVSATFNYALSARTRITVSPNYTYATTSGQATSTTFPSVNEFGVNTNLTHDLTPSSGVNAAYTEQTDILSGSSYKTIYQSLQGGYFHSFHGGWSLSGSFGFITANFQNGRNWSESGTGSVVKAFRRSRAAISYYRGHTFSGYISQQFSDRVDASYQLYVGRHWTMGGGIGYLRDVVTANGVWGKYGEGNLSYGLTPTLSLFGSYVYKWQRGDDIAVFSGTTSYLRCGIQWTPRQPTAR
jgi:hypothetical protein